MQLCGIIAGNLNYMKLDSQRKRGKGEKNVRAAQPFPVIGGSLKISREGLLVTMSHVGPGPDLEYPVWMIQLSPGTFSHET